MNPESTLSERWEYFVKDADRPKLTADGQRRRARDLTFLDPAGGSGHFLLEAFDLFYSMYEEASRAPVLEKEGAGRDGSSSPLSTPSQICASILNHNLFAIDIDERAMQIATVALWMKATERSPDLRAEDLHSFHAHWVATNIRLPKEKDHLDAFLKKHPEDEPLRPALEKVFQGLQNAHELGSLLQIEQPVEAELRSLQARYSKLETKGGVQNDLGLPPEVRQTVKRQCTVD